MAPLAGQCETRHLRLSRFSLRRTTGRGLRLLADRAHDSSETDKWRNRDGTLANI